MSCVEKSRNIISNMTCWSTSSQNSDENDAEGGRSPLLDHENEVPEQYRIGKYDAHHLKPHKKRSHPMHSLEILFSPTFWSSSNLGKAAITFLFLYYAIFGVFYGLPYCPKDWDDDEYKDKYEEDCEDVYFTQQKIKHEIKQMLQAHKLYTKVITFVLGFYVATMMGRWWSQISKLPDITQVAMKLNALVCPNNSAETEQAEEMKRRILRYCMLSYYLLMIEVNGPKTFKKSFIGRAYVCFTRDKKAPKYSTLKFHEVEVKGLLVGQEKDIFDGKSKDLEKYWWVPMNWACKLVQENLGMIKYADEVVKSLTAYQHNLQSLLEYHMNPFPSLSRQVAHLACWAYILFSAFATQKFDGYEDNYTWIMFFTGEFPFVPMVMITILFSLLRMAEICESPFDYDNYWDVHVKKEIDIQLFIGSLALDPRYATPPPLPKPNLMPEKSEDPDGPCGVKQD